MKRSAFFPTLLSCTVASLYSEPSNAQELDEWRTKTDSSPGVVFVLEETARTTLTDKTQEVTYRLLASGFPQGKTYSLWFTRIGEDSRRLVNKLYVDDSGVMIAQELQPGIDVPFLPAPLADVLPLTVDHFQPGEPVSLSLVSEDKQIKGYGKAFPVPIEDRDGSCHLYLELITPDRMTYAAWGTGFAPNEELTTESLSNGEVIRSKRSAESDGGFLEILLPATKRRSQGRATFSVTGTSCSLLVRYDWGRSKSKK